MPERLINILLEKEVFEKIDVIFAKTCIKQKELSESHLFLAYLFCAMRNGHHCISLNERSMSPNLIYENDLMEAVKTAVINGAKLLPKELIQKADQSLSLKPVVRDNNSYYLQKSYIIENELIEHLKKILLEAQAFFDKKQIDRVSILFEKQLYKTQLEAIKKVLSKSLGFLTGGPGSGKTYTAAYLLKVFEKLFENTGKVPKIALAAPTGKATSRLKESLEKAGYEQDLQTSTIHQLLNLKSKRDLFLPRHKLSFDLILIDEASMIDTALFMVLLKSISSKTQVVFLGDPFQLPPVESGTVFAELALNSKVIPVANLSTSIRMENEDLLNLSKVVLGRKDTTYLNDLNSQHIAYERIGSYTKAIQSLDRCLDGYLNSFLFLPLSGEVQYEALLEELNQYKLLSPLNKGVWGVDTINSICLERQLEKAQRGDKYAIPIMLTKNDYDLGLFNGMEGICIKHIADNSKRTAIKDFALFKKDGKVNVYPMTILKSYQYSFCLSVHKSQGSEYDHLTILLPCGAEKFGTEMLYTAITRAKKTLKILAYDYSFEKMNRISHLKETNLTSKLLLKFGTGLSA